MDHQLLHGIPHGWHISAFLDGTVLRLVRCEECSTEYVYRLERTGSGQGYSHLFLDKDGARKRAEQRARADLEHKLQVNRDVVPCPTCGHIQTDMIPRARSLQFAWLLRLGIALLLAGTVLFLVTVGLGAGVSQSGRMPFWVFIVSIGVLFLGGLGGLGAVVTQLWLSLRYDPNASPVAARLEQGRRFAQLRVDLERDLGHPLNRPPTAEEMVDLR